MNDAFRRSPMHTCTKLAMPPLRALVLALLPLVLLPFAPAVGWCAYESYRIEMVYSNADGTIQFVQLRESQGLSGQRALAGRTLTVTHGPTTRSFSFPADLPGNDTANRRVLIATPAFASLSLLAPDYILPAGFLPTDSGPIDYAAIDVLTYAALPTDGSLALSRSGATVPNVAVNFAGASAVVPGLPVAAVEYYHPGLDHYFITDLHPDIDALDSGRIAGWSRTGERFMVHPSPATASGPVNPVCRFYIPPAHGNSHFFSASPAECSTIADKATTDPNYSGYILETSAAFHIALPEPVTGACPAGTAPVYRLWNQRADSNHRYVATAALKAQMVARHYLPEGYGPDATIMCAPTPGTASVRFLAGSAAPNGAIVSDAASIPAANYQGYATPTDLANVGPRRGSGEVIAFSERRAVTLRPTAWSTSGSDQTVAVTLAAELVAPVTIWVVAGPYASTQQTALTLWSTAQQIYADERLGVRLPLEVIDATGNPKAANWGAFTCGSGNANVGAIRSDIGAKPGRINVYLVGLVDGSTSRGNSCEIGGSFVAIAAGSGAELLAHELGHDFALEHIDDLTASFDNRNVMHSASNSRMYLTEGQSFRAHLRPASALNAVYNLRPGQVTRACDRDTLTVTCPAIAKRVWADGPFPAN